ncbi:uncharacterized protein LOC111086681 isoform X2 [Limulus polyphemus]|uniref:Uncharacterized protein LOC111086681 isoform X2 n=1 Tax=Limulus polyphemus TaxID=6850 RepID=A0ABM1SRE2_LIMPO|nr:uncharacterized protein LOC111086681 isoform X2 [Limulus polyphemus]
MSDCTTSVVIEFNVSDFLSPSQTYLSKQSSSKTNNQPQGYSARIVGNSHTDETFLCKQVRKLTVESSVSSPSYDKLIDITEGEADNEQSYSSNEKLKDTPQSRCEEEKTNNKQLPSCDISLQDSMIFSDQSLNIGVWYRKEEIRRGSTNSSEANHNVGKSGSWSPSMIGGEEELLENETFDFNISVTSPCSFGIGEDDVFQELNTQTHEKTFSKEDKVSINKLDSSKLSDVPDIWHSLSREDMVKVRNEASDVIRRLAVNEDGEQELNTKQEKEASSVGCNISPVYTCIYPNKQLKPTSESLGVRRRSRSIALQTDDTNLYLNFKEEASRTTKFKLKSVNSTVDVFSQTEYMDDKENYSDKVNESLHESNQLLEHTLPTCSPQETTNKKSTTVIRKGTYTLKSSPLTAEIVREKCRAKKKKTNSQVVKSCDLDREGVSVPSDAHASTATPPLDKISVRSKVTCLKSSTPVGRTASTSATLSSRKAVSVSSQPPIGSTVPSKTGQRCTPSFNSSQGSSQNSSVIKRENFSKLSLNHSRPSLQKTGIDTSVNSSGGSSKNTPKSRKNVSTCIKVGAVATSGLRPPSGSTSSHTRQRSNSGSSLSSKSSTSSISSKSKLPRTTLSVENLSTSQIQAQTQLTRSTKTTSSLKRSELKRPICGTNKNSNQPAATKPSALKAHATIKHGPLKESPSQMIKPVAQGVSKIRNSSDPNQKVLKEL